MFMCVIFDSNKLGPRVFLVVDEPICKLPDPVYLSTYARFLKKMMMIIKNRIRLKVCLLVGCVL